MKRLIREPLLHFLLAGTLLFVAHGWLNRGGGNVSQVVHISAAEVTWLKETWSRQWHRAPTEQELRGLVTDYLKEVLLAREALELGLDQNDTIVRRRLAQKMEFLVQDTARMTEPDDAELRRYYDAERDRYQAPLRLSFQQIYFKSEVAARAALDGIGTRNVTRSGAPSMLEREYLRVDAQDVASIFGPGFADSVFALEAGRWQGPVASGYGYHLVRVDERHSVEPIAFDAVRAKVLADWQRAEQIKAREKFFARLLVKYDVVADASIKALIGPLSEAVR